MVASGDATVAKRRRAELLSARSTSVRDDMKIALWSVAVLVIGAPLWVGCGGDEPTCSVQGDDIVCIERAPAALVAPRAAGGECPHGGNDGIGEKPDLSGLFGGKGSDAAGVQQSALGELCRKFGHVVSTLCSSGSGFSVAKGPSPGPVGTTAE